MDIEGLDLHEDDVVLLTSGVLQKYGGFIREFTGKFVNLGLEQHFTRGVEIQFLRTTGGGWQKGKLHLRFEFVPEKSELEDDPDSLNSFRQ